MGARGVSAVPRVDRGARVVYVRAIASETDTSLASDACELRALVRDVAAELACSAAEVEPIQLVGRARVLRCAEVVIKVHAVETRHADLANRLRAVSSSALRPLFVQPLEPRIRHVGGRALSLWPLALPRMVDTPEQVDWEACAELLAALHRVVPGAGKLGRVLPTTSWAERLGRARDGVLGLSSTPESRCVLRAFETLERPETFERLETLERSDARERPEPREADRQLGAATTRSQSAARSAPIARRDRRLRVVHGDWHPGQVLWEGGEPRLIDVDDLGLGDPRWDLARPAGWHLAGLLSSQVWTRFSTAYLRAGGCAIEDPADPWRDLERPARAAVVQSAASALIRRARERRSLEDFEQLLVDACSRMLRSSPSS